MRHYSRRGSSRAATRLTSVDEMEVPPSFSNTAVALVGALVGGGLKVLGALDGGVDEQAHRPGEPLKALGEEMIEHGVGLGMGEV